MDVKNQHYSSSNRMHVKNKENNRREETRANQRLKGRTGLRRNKIKIGDTTPRRRRVPRSVDADMHARCRIAVCSAVSVATRDGVTAEAVALEGDKLGAVGGRCASSEGGTALACGGAVVQETRVGVEVCVV